MANEKMNNAMLIDAVRRYDVLYNRQNPKYRDNFHRQSLWNLIATEVPFFKDGKAANARWKQLRQAYTRFRKKMIERPKLLDCLEKPDDCASSLDDFNSERWANMRWLEPYLEETDENFLLLNDSYGECDDSTFSKFPYSNCKEDPEFSPCLEDPRSSVYLKSDCISKLKFNNLKRKYPGDNKPESNDKNLDSNGGEFDENFNQQLFEAMAAQFSQSVQESQSTSHNLSSQSIVSPVLQPALEGEEEAYGRYITEKMKKLTPQQRFQARMKIENMFYELEYGKLEL